MLCVSSNVLPVTCWYIELWKSRKMSSPRPHLELQTSFFLIHNFRTSDSVYFCVLLLQECWRLSLYFAAQDTVTTALKPYKVSRDSWVRNVHLFLSCLLPAQVTVLWMPDNDYPTWHKCPSKKKKQNQVGKENNKSVRFVMPRLI